MGQAHIISNRGPARGREQDKYGYYTFFKFYYKYFSTPSGLVSLGGSVLNTDTNNTSTAINCLLGVALKKNSVHTVCTMPRCIHAMDGCHMSSPHDPTARIRLPFMGLYRPNQSWINAVGRRKTTSIGSCWLDMWQPSMTCMQRGMVHTVCTEFFRRSPTPCHARMHSLIASPIFAWMHARTQKELFKGVLDKGM